MKNNLFLNYLYSYLHSLVNIDLYFHNRNSYIVDSVENMEEELKKDEIR